MLASQHALTLTATALLTWRHLGADRDMETLRREATAVLSARLLPGDYELQPKVQGDGGFRDGKVLFAVYLN